MLVSFSLQNWMSFKEEGSISMVASKERQHGERVPTLGKYKTKILPLAIIYGGNASGKTNLFKALAFIKHLVVMGTHPSSTIPAEVFLVDPMNAAEPARFVLELLIGEKMYAFTFAVTRKAVLEEKLAEISTTNEKVLYERTANQIKFDATLQKDSSLHFAFKGTRDNQLFLTNSVSQGVDTFRPVYDWFENSLQLVAPDSRFGRTERFVEAGNPMLCAMSDALARLDIGITKLDFEKSAGKLVTLHSDSHGEDIKFGMECESDGTRRVIDLLPVFLDLCADSSRKVYVVDELDQNLHTVLTRRLLEGYLSRCSPRSRAQLLFTTYDVLLMDQELLRRDEMWVTERTASGASRLASFSEYKDVRYDRDIRKSYLQGRLGGVPRIFFDGRTLRS